MLARGCNAVVACRVDPGGTRVLTRRAVRGVDWRCVAIGLRGMLRLSSAY